MLSGKRGKKAQRVIGYSLLAVIAVLVLLPVFWMLVSSLKPASEIFHPGMFGSRLAWDNYVEAWTYAPFGRFFLNSVFVSGSIVLLELTTASLAAYAFARLRFPGRDTLFYLYLATLMIPGQVVMVPLFILINYWGWIDTYQALIIPKAFTAFGTFLLRQFFLTIPFELEEAGRIDGCSRFGLYARIILPLSTSILAVLAIFIFVQQWNNFLWPLIVINTENMKTLPIGLNYFQGLYGTEWHLMMAAAAIVIVPTVIVFAFLQRYLQEGITISGMGGR